MGIPEQNIKILLEPNDVCFTFKANNRLTINKSQSNNIINYTEIIGYNKTFQNENIDYNKNYKLYEREEAFYLYKCNDLINKTDENTNLTTYLTFLYELINNNEEFETLYGKMGLNMNNNEEISKCPGFLSSLKNKNIIDKYIWHIDFYSHFHGYFYLGPEPHLYSVKNNRNAIYNEYQYIKLNTITSNDNNIQWKLLFNKILFKNKTNQYTNYFNDKMAIIDINLGLIIGTSEYQQVLEDNFFNVLMRKNICKKTIVEYIINNEKTKYYIYSCKETFNQGEEDGVLFSYYDLFPELELFHINFENNFKLTKYELFEKINGDYYFLIIFNADNKNNIWKFGQPFLRRHQMIFDIDSKALGYYDRAISEKNEDKNIDENKIDNEEEVKYDNITNDNAYNRKIKDKIFINIIIKYFLLILCFVLVSIISFYFGMKIKETRKKRANELKDDFEYNSHNNSINTSDKYSQKIELNKIGV